ncbi:MAG: hypothetical protein ABJK11_06180 [Balneola sp.]
MPDGRHLHMLPFFDLMFPGSYKSSSITLDGYSDAEPPTDFMVTTRVFTHAGSRDYELELNKQT